MLRNMPIAHCIEQISSNTFFKTFKPYATKIVAVLQYLYLFCFARKIVSFLIP